MESEYFSRTPLIIAIEGNSREDGPGIRSVIFFKGCPLNCLWCQNPESKQRSAELWWDRDKCIECGDCINVCPQGALSAVNSEFLARDKCDLDFECVRVCPTQAVQRIGQNMSADEIIRKVLRYKPFFDTSGGGVTLSGGEPMLNMQFTSDLLPTV